jgi:hypothetical protein
MTCQWKCENVMGNSSLEPRAAMLGYVPPRLTAMADWCATHPDAALRRNGFMYRAHAQWLAAGARGPADPVQVRDA